MNTDKRPTMTAAQLAAEAMQANDAARKDAQDRGGPAREVEALMSAPERVLIGREYVLEPMTAGIAQIWRRRLKMQPAEMSAEEMIYIFARPQYVWQHHARRWRAGYEVPEGWLDEVTEFAFLLTKDVMEQASEWVTRELNGFFGLPVPTMTTADEPSQPAPDAKEVEPDGGSERSRESSPPTDTPAEATT